MAFDSVIFAGEKFNETTNSWKPVTFVASYHEDGYCYFNDDFKYRCLIDGSHLQLFYINKEIWIDTTIIKDLRPASFNFENLIFNLFSGGTHATNAHVEAAVQWLVNKASNNYVTYSNYVRNLYTDGYSYDCSSFVITGFYLGGGFNIRGASSTRDMRNYFVNAGFIWIPGFTWYSNQLKRGDILIKEFDPGGHTQVYIGNNKDVNCGSTPARVQDHNINNSSYGVVRGWDGILRYNG